MAMYEPAPDPKTSNRQNADCMTDNELNKMFEMLIGQPYLIQDNLEHSLEVAHVWG